MNKIGIFGDSFADPSHGHSVDPTLSSNAWIYKLNQEVDVYAKGGSSFYYSYNKFLQNHTKYERNIFVCTALTRIPVTIDEFTEINHWMLTCGSGRVAKDHLELNHLESVRNRKICQAISDWYDYLMPHFPFLDFGYLMYNEIKKIRPDTLFKPVHYYDPSNDYNINIPGPSMTDYASLLVNSFKPEYNGRDSWLEVYTEIPEKRTVCHFTVEVNDLLASHVISALETNIWNPSLPSYIKQDSPFDYYFETSKTGHWLNKIKLD